MRGPHRVLNGVSICELAQQLDGAGSNVAVVMRQQRQNMWEASQPYQLWIQLWRARNGLEPA